MGTMKKCLKDELAQKDAVIDQMLRDPDVKIKEDGTVWIKRTRRPPAGGAEVDKQGFRNCVLRNGKRHVVYYKGYMLSVSRIVYRKFLGELDVDHEVIHIDKDSLNNSPHNLKLAMESGGAGQSLRRFSDIEVMGIRERKARGESLSSIAASVGASSIVVSKIVRGDTYKDVGGPLSKGGRVVPKGSDNSRSKLTHKQRDSLLKERSRGASLRVLAEKFGLSKSGVSRICTKEEARIKHFQTATL